MWRRRKSEAVSGAWAFMARRRGARRGDAPFLRQDELKRAPTTKFATCSAATLFMDML